MSDAHTTTTRTDDHPNPLGRPAIEHGLSDAEKSVISQIADSDSWVGRVDATAIAIQNRARELCLELDRVSPADATKRNRILGELLPPDSHLPVVMPPFRCDYGFNIHFGGFVFLNYGVTILDTSPIRIGQGTFIAPGVTISATGHALDPAQRAQAISTSEAIAIGSNVWIGANATLCAGVTIGDDSVIGAGAVVTHDIPAGVVAAGVPARVLRELGPDDRVTPTLSQASGTPPSEG